MVLDASFYSLSTLGDLLVFYVLNPRAILLTLRGTLWN